MMYTGTMKFDFKKVLPGIMGSNNKTKINAESKVKTLDRTLYPTHTLPPASYFSNPRWFDGGESKMDKRILDYFLK